MTGSKSAFSLMCENVQRVFIDNPLAGVANILLIFVLLLGIIALIGVIFKKKDQSVGAGFLRPFKGIFMFFGLAIFVELIREHYIIASVVALTVACAGVAAYIVYKRMSGSKDEAADNALDFNQTPKEVDQKQVEEPQVAAESNPV